MEKEKYVAFIDILGFKEKLQRINQAKAEILIQDFIAMLEERWKTNQLMQNENIGGYIVSDSVVLYSKDCTEKSLRCILEYTTQVFRLAFDKNGILLRGAIAKGAFRRLEEASLVNLDKGLIVGNAYIEAYNMESRHKASAIVMGGAVKDDVEEYFFGAYDIRELQGENPPLYTIRWADIDYLLEKDHLERFVRLAHGAQWLPHYYQTLYMFLTNVKSDKKIQAVFEKVCLLLQEQYDYQAVNRFIQNVFAGEVNVHFKEMFLKYLRKKIFQ